MSKKQILRGQPVALLPSQSTEFDSAEERINLDTPNIASDDIAKILPQFDRSIRSNNVDKLHLLKICFSSSWRSSNGIRF